MGICKSCQRQIDDRSEICPYCGTVKEKPQEISLFLVPKTRLKNRYTIEDIKEYDSYTITYLAYDETLLQWVEIRELMPLDLVTRSGDGLKVAVIGIQQDRLFQEEKRKVFDEAKILAKFQNEEGIVKILDGFEENGTIYIVMEHVKGEILSNFLTEHGPMNPASATELITPISEALEKVHNTGIIHRSICPENIIVTSDGKGKLKNFGTARQQNAFNNETLTISVRHGFTPEEQYYRSGVQSFSTDVYGLCATLYKMLTGLTPIDGMTRRSYIDGGKKDPLVMPRKLNKEISKSLEATLLNGMAVRAENRTGSIKGFLDELNSDRTISMNKVVVENKKNYKWPLWAKIGIPIGTLMIIFALSFVVRFGTTKLNEPSTNLDGLIEVPGVEGMEKEAAIRDIEDCKLRGIAVGNIESSFVEVGTVVLQDPQKGSYLRENGAVLLTINGGAVKPPVNGKATVPIVEWSTVKETEQKFKDAGLAKPIIIEQPSETVASGLVISTSTPSGSEVDEGSQVVITVSTGSSEPQKEELEKFGKILSEERIWVKENKEVLIEEPQEAGYTAISLDEVEFTLLDGEYELSEESAINTNPDDKKLKILNKEDGLEYIFASANETIFLIDIVDTEEKEESSQNNNSKTSNIESYYINNSRTRAAFLNSETIDDYGTADEYNKSSIWIIEPTNEYSDVDEVAINFALMASKHNYDYGLENGYEFNENRFNKKGYPQQWYPALIPENPDQDVYHFQNVSKEFTYDAGAIIAEKGTYWCIMNYNGEILYEPIVDIRTNEIGYKEGDSPLKNKWNLETQGVGFINRTIPLDEDYKDQYVSILSKDFRSIDTEILFKGHIERKGLLEGYLYFFNNGVLHRSQYGERNPGRVEKLTETPIELYDSIQPIINKDGSGQYDVIAGNIYIDHNGNQVTQNAALIKHFVNGYYVGLMDKSRFSIYGNTSIGASDRVALINANTGNSTTDFIYEDALYFEEGFCPVKRNGKWGFIDETGNEVTEMIFDRVSSVYEGKVAVIYEGHFGIINLKDALSDGFLTKESLGEVANDIENPSIKQASKTFDIELYDRCYTSVSKPIKFLNKWNSMNDLMNRGDADIKKGYQWFYDKYKNEEDSEGYILVTDEVKKDIKKLARERGYAADWKEFLLYRDTDKTGFNGYNNNSGTTYVKCTKNTSLDYYDKYYTSCTRGIWFLNRWESIEDVVINGDADMVADYSVFYNKYKDMENEDGYIVVTDEILADIKKLAAKRGFESDWKEFLLYAEIDG